MTTPSQVERGRHAGDAPVGVGRRRWVVYSTFEPLGRAQAYVAAQLSAYREIGFETLVVDSSPVLAPERRQCWHELATLWVRRPNEGYDFGSYKAGLASLLQTVQVGIAELAVVFTNDSCYGPYSSLDEVIRPMDASPVGERRVFGITDSDELQHHLQSYWLYFRPEVAHLAQSFFDAMPDITNRESAVQSGELGLSAYLLAEGCMLVALLPIDEVVSHFGRFRGRLLSIVELGIRRWLKRPRYTAKGDGACLKQFLGLPHSCNPTTAYGSHLHFEGLSPFVKRQLIRDNPERDAFVPPLEDVASLDNADVDRLLRSTDRYRRRYRTTR